ncbi:MAG: class I SAM-dependent methyltransferase [Planctomycetota bacterium]
MDWYRRAEEYDIWFSWDPATERDFVLGCSERWGIARPRRILEPMCGPGRLLRAMPGWAVGLDIGEAMVRIAGRTNPVFRADAARFAVREGSFDLAFNLIDSFRHLRSEQAAHDHLRCTARALRAGAVYVLGLEINGDIPADVHRDEWELSRDGHTIKGFVEGVGDTDPASRTETMRIAYEFDGEPREYFHTMRTYTRLQMEELIDDEASFEIAAVFDRHYDLEKPIELSEVAGSAVLVLRKG